MSAGGAFGGARGYQPRPPEKGVFPLDHFGECKQLKEDYLDCLKRSGHKAAACQELSKQYLQCRMERNLMAAQDLRDLGFKDSTSGGEAPQAHAKGGEEATGGEDRRQAGFVAGIRR